jgi:hypothetical protein
MNLVHKGCTCGAHMVHVVCENGAALVRLTNLVHKGCACDAQMVHEVCEHGAALVRLMNAVHVVCEKFFKI